MANPLEAIKRLFGRATRPLLSKVVLWAAACLGVFSILGFLVLPPILRNVLTQKLSETLHREVAIQEVRF
ncbi:MAG TPA: hypothetical protein VJM82_07915, partial [Nitrospiraceae bacterium]|nr:hypothetical protein [Nitrospiraceae bacterium]